MSVKTTYTLKKQLKACQKETSRLELENMRLKLDLERRVVEFMNSTQDIFAVVDSLFTEDDVRTLNEAKNKWLTFKTVLDNGGTMEQALDAIDREPNNTPEKNAEILIKWWSKDKEKTA